MQAILSGRTMLILLATLIIWTIIFCDQAPFPVALLFGIMFSFATTVIAEMVLPQNRCQRGGLGFPT